VVCGGDLGLVGDQPRDAHYVGVVAGVVAEGAGGEDYAGVRRSLRVEAGFECGGFLVRESLAVLAPESLGAALLELRLSLALAADGAALTGLLAGAFSFDRLGAWGAAPRERTQSPRTDSRLSSSAIASRDGQRLGGNDVVCAMSAVGAGNSFSSAELRSNSRMRPT
jgi:hypothetical protein